MREALERLASVRHNGGLLDLQLPDGSGYLVAECAHAPGVLNALTPLVALSAYHEPDAKSGTLFAAKFEKPITAARLRSALQLFG